MVRVVVSLYKMLSKWNSDLSTLKTEIYARRKDQYMRQRILNSFKETVAFYAKRFNMYGVLMEAIVYIPHSHIFR